MGQLKCRGSSVVEQTPEERRVVSSILTRGTNLAQKILGLNLGFFDLLN